MSALNFQAVVFDLDNTLYDEAVYFEAVLVRFLSEIGREDVDVSGLVDIGERLKARDYLGDLLKKLSLYSEDMQEKLFSLYCGLDQRIRLDNSVVSGLARLKAMSLRLGVVTNGVVTAQKSKVLCLSLAEHVDHITYARELGKAYEKPHPVPFKDICEKIACEANQVLFVGDHPVNDIMGAKYAGMQTAWLANPYFSKPVQADFVANSIDELVGKIANET